MIGAGRLLGLVLAALALAPASAGAHAYLLEQAPEPSAVLGKTPPQVLLGFNEPIEAEFAVISVTDKDANRVTKGIPRRAEGSRSTLTVPLDRLGPGWYLVYYRVVSADGHPIRGAYTFAVGPSPGPPPQFDIPSLEETAATGPLLTLRWVVLLSMMSAVGLLMFRLLIARPLLRRVPDASLRAVSVGLAVTLGVALLSTLAYVNATTADFAQRSFWDLGATVPSWRESMFGRGYSDALIVLVAMALASALALRLDRPERERRSIAELAAVTGALLAAAALMLIPGLAGHAGQNSPRGLSLTLDWVHMVAGAIWIGGLIGISLVAWRASTRRVACMVVVVPRFSRVALISVLALMATGTVAAILQLPTLESLWQTGYGQALIAKIAILLVAMVLAAVNLLRTKPRLEAVERRPGLGESTTGLLRRLVGGETVLVVGAVFAAGIMSSLPPPPDALAQLGSARAEVGPAPVRERITEGDYELEFSIGPNKAAQPSAFEIKVWRNGTPVDDADVVARFSMLDMDMGVQKYRFTERGPGVYGNPNLPALVMAGLWGLDFRITPPGDEPLDVLLVDEVRG